MQRVAGELSVHKRLREIRFVPGLPRGDMGKERYPWRSEAESVVELDTVYILLEGQLVVVTDEGETVLERLDAVRVTAGSLRAVLNRTTLSAGMLVIRPNPDA